MLKNKYYEELRETLREEENEEIPAENLKPAEDANDRTEVRKTIAFVLGAMAALAVIEALVILFFFGGSISSPEPAKWKMELGLLIGLLLGVGYLFTIKLQIDATLSGTPHPNGKMKIGAFLRYIVVIVLIGVGVFTNWFHSFTAIIGLYNLKLASFITGLVRNRKSGKTAQQKAPENDPEPEIGELLDELDKF